METEKMVRSRETFMARNQTKDFKTLRGYNVAIDNFENYCMEKHGKADVILELKEFDKEQIYDFLAIDHIAGRTQMDSEPKLVKLGYSSKLEGSSLQKWIIKNNFPEGFQILCQNCNFSKGKKKNNNKCVHEK